MTSKGKRRDVASLGFVPDPAVEAYYQLIRAFLSLGVFDALKENELTAPELAARCGVTAMPVFQIALDCAAELNLLELDGDRYRNGPYGEMLADPARKYSLLNQYMVNTWYRHVGTYLKTGVAMHFHHHMSGDELAEYQSFFRHSQAGPRLAGMPFASPPTHILDIGGSSGNIVKPLLDKYPDAKATIVDLADVVTMMDNEENVGAYRGRLRYQVGDARTVAIEPGAQNVVILANLLHHLSRSHVDDLLRRACRGLPPNGSLAVLHGFPEENPTNDPLDRLAALQFTFSSGEEAFPYGDFKALLAREGMSEPVTNDGWYLATKRV